MSSVSDSKQKQPLEVFHKKGVLKNFANFTGKHLYWNLLLTKLQVYRPVAKKTYLEEHLGTTVSVISKDT